MRFVVCLEGHNAQVELKFKIVYGTVNTYYRLGKDLPYKRITNL